MLTIPLSAEKKHSGAPVEPTAGQWRTWAISSGKDYSVPPAARAQRDARGTPCAGRSDRPEHGRQQRADRILGCRSRRAYRWMDLISNRLLAGTPTTAFPHRVYTYVAHGDVRRDGSRLGLEVLLQPAAAERAGSTVCRPPWTSRQPVVSLRTRRSGAGRRRGAAPISSRTRRQTFQVMADEAGRSRVLAGVQFPSDYDAGADARAEEWPSR